MTISALLALVRKPKVAIPIVIGVVIVLAWLLVFFLPEGTKISNNQAKYASLQTKQANLNAEVLRLEHDRTVTPQLQAKLSELKTLVPEDANPFGYILDIKQAASSANVGISAYSPVGTPAAVPGTSVTAIEIPVSIKGTYDQTLAFIKDIYSLPRLTSITSVSINGGGLGTNRTTQLDVTLQLVIYTTGKAAIPIAG